MGGESPEARSSPRAGVRANADQSAPATISAPPARMRTSSVAAPSATDETLANSTSDSMITEVTLAASLGAPYCRHTLATTKPVPSSAAQPSQPGEARAGESIAPSAVPVSAATPASTVQPQNMASARDSPGASRRWRSTMLVTAKPKPAATPSQSGRLEGTGHSVPGAFSTTTTPVSASATRASAPPVGRSPSSSQASSTLHSGIR
jgi:hypothetical protein